MTHSQNTFKGNEAYATLERLRDAVLENARDDVGQNPLSDAENFLDAAAISRTLEVLVTYLYADAPQSRGLSNTKERR